MVARSTETTNLDNHKEIYPRKPLLSSQALDWKGGAFQHYRQPAGETPYVNSIPTHYVIAAHHTLPDPNGTNLIPSEQWLEGCRQVRIREPGDISIIPPNILTKNTWHREYFSNCLRSCGSRSD
jgi:hypothetical protein